MKTNKNWLNVDDSEFYYGGKRAVEWFNEQIVKRREKYPILSNKAESPRYEAAIDALKKNGWAHLPKILDMQLLTKIRDNANKIIEKGKNLKINDEYFAFISQPLINVDGVSELAFSDLLVDIAEEFFECTPAIGTLSLRRNKLTNLPSKNTLLYHCDANSIKFFKFFIYLNDVDEVSHGPFTIIEGTNKIKHSSWNAKHRWSDKEIKNLYGKEKIKYCYGNMGDLLMATTTAFHKGTQPISQERLVLVINYVVHPELGSGVPQKISFKVSKEFVESLPEDKKPIADFLIKV